MLQRLLRAKAPTEQRDENGETALHVAARHGNLNGISSLLDAGANVDAVSSRAWTPLHLACRYGCANIVLVLIRSGANVDRSGCYGWTALNFAIQNRHQECQKMLLEFGTIGTTNDYCSRRNAVGVVRQQWGIYRLSAKPQPVESVVPIVV